MISIVIDLQDEILPMRYALSRKQLQSDDKDTALEMLTEIRDKIAQEKKIKTIVVKAGDVINIEKDIKLRVLWPDSKNKINENVLNNNSLVCKLEYRNFSMMLTGDIEEIAENAILTKYKNNAKILKANILKVAHHRL